MQKNNAKVIFTFAIIITGIFFLYFSRSFPERSKVMPYAVSLIVLFLSIIEIMTDIVPGFSKLKLGKIDYLNKNISAIRVKTTSYHEQKTKNCKNQLGFYKILVWIFITIICIYFLGFLVVLPICIGLFYRFEAGYTWVKALVTSLLYEAIVFLLFQILLNVELYKGILFQ